MVNFFFFFFFLIVLTWSFPFRSCSFFHPLFFLFMRSLRVLSSPFLPFPSQPRPSSFFSQQQQQQQQQQQGGEKERKNEEGVALYVHWPFCSSICNYCDFNRYLQTEQTYSVQLENEMAQVRQVEKKKKKAKN